MKTPTRKRKTVKRFDPSDYDQPKRARRRTPAKKSRGKGRKRSKGTRRKTDAPEDRFSVYNGHNQKTDKEACDMAIRQACNDIESYKKQKDVCKGIPARLKSAKECKKERLDMPKLSHEQAVAAMGWDWIDK